MSECKCVGNVLRFDCPVHNKEARAKLLEMASKGAKTQHARKTKSAIAEGIAAVEEDEAQFDLEGMAALMPGRPKAIASLYKDLRSRNEKVRQTAAQTILAYTDGRPGQRDEDDEPHEIVFRTEALPVDGEIRHEAEKPALAFEL